MSYTRWYALWPLTRSKVKVTEVWKLRKWPITKSISSVSMHAKTDGNYDTPRQCLDRF